MGFYLQHRGSSTQLLRLLPAASEDLLKKEMNEAELERNSFKYAVV